MSPYAEEKKAIVAQYDNVPYVTLAHRFHFSISTSLTFIEHIRRKAHEEHQSFVLFFTLKFSHLLMMLEWKPYTHTHLNYTDLLS